MTQMKSVQWVEYYLGSILLQYRKYVTLTFYIWPWPFCLTLTLMFDLELDLLPHWALKNKIAKKNKCLYDFRFKSYGSWRKNGTSFVISETTIPIGISSRNMMRQTRFPVSKLWLKRWFSWFSICLTLTLTFQGHLIFENSPFVPVHDWCKFWSDMFINSGDIAHWNMEKLPMLYNGNFRCHGNVCYVFRIRPIFLHIPSDRSKHDVCQFWEESVEIDDFRRFHKSTISHR